MNLIEFFSTLGIFSITIGQSIMILVGLLLIYLAINKKFEPLLLLPIGFGALLTNIPEIGLSMSPIEKLIYANNPVEISTVISELSISELNLSAARLIPTSFHRRFTHKQKWNNLDGFVVHRKRQHECGDILNGGQIQTAVTFATLQFFQLYNARRFHPFVVRNPRRQ